MSARWCQSLYEQNIQLYELCPVASAQLCLEYLHFNTQKLHTNISYVTCHNFNTTQSFSDLSSWSHCITGPVPAKGKNPDQVQQKPQPHNIKAKQMERKVQVRGTQHLVFIARQYILCSVPQLLMFCHSYYKTKFGSQNFGYQNW